MTRLVFLLNIICYASTSYSQDTIIVNGYPCYTNGSLNIGNSKYISNMVKNRSRLPTSLQFDTTITLQQLIAPSAIKGRFSEGKAARITGYVYSVYSGGRETCNCMSDQPGDKDTHIILTPSSTDTTKNHQLVTEVTPRARKRINTAWSQDSLKKLKGKIVIIEGWLFFDQTHIYEDFATNPFNNRKKKNWRASCWELHPLTSIKVL